MPRVQQQFDKEKYRKRYLRLSLILFLLTIICILWIVFLVVSVYYLGFGNKWAGLTMDYWIIGITGIISFFILLELVFLIHYLRIKRKTTKRIRPKQSYFQGKRLHHYTLPSEAKGGLYSKTYIIIDDRNLLNLRFQIIPPEQLWKIK